MWTASSEELPHAMGERFTFKLNARPATFADVVHGWQTDASFRSLFNNVLAGAPFTSFHWETPPVTADTATRPFEFVLLNSLDHAPDPDVDAFADQFPAAVAGVAVFNNFRGDAILVVPSPLADHAAYGHLAAFVRLAPPQQQDKLWQAVGNALSKRISIKPVWLNTAGAEISWLHVRLDDRPKYYGYAPYR
jgi:hypothetical protein